MKKMKNNTIGILLLLFVVLFSGCKEDEITNISAETLVIDQPGVTLEPGDSSKLTAMVMPGNAGNRAVFWKSSDPRIASVTDDGWVKASKPGTVTITAIAYSNTGIRSEVPATVNGIPDDVVSGVAGTYTGDLNIMGMGTTPNTELTLQQEGFYSVRLITSVDLTSMYMGNVPIDILTSVDRSPDGEGFIISGKGDAPPIGPITVEGTVDADGNIALEIYVAAFDATATYIGKNVANIEEIVTGTYVGDVIAGAPVGSNVEVIIKRENNKYKLQIDDNIASYPFQTEIEITVLRNGNDLTISSNPGTATVAGNTTQVTITSGTITSAGDLGFYIEIMGLTDLGAPTNTATYTGKKLENPAKVIAGTYEGIANVPIPGMPPTIPATITLTRSGNQVILTSTVTIPSMTPLVLDIPMDVLRSGANYGVSGNGSDENYGPISISGTVDNIGQIDLTISVGGMSVTYTGQKQ
jgi:hypothetical protein